MYGILDKNLLCTLSAEDGQNLESMVYVINIFMHYEWYMLIVLCEVIGTELVWWLIFMLYYK